MSRIDELEKLVLKRLERQNDDNATWYAQAAVRELAQTARDAKKAQELVTELATIVNRVAEENT